MKSAKAEQAGRGETGGFAVGTLHKLFEARAAESSPAAVALVFGEQRLTYADLNARANQLAHYLKKRGVRPEVMVGVCLERSLELVVAILGILKAGGAYVPLDAAYPRERISFMLADAGIKVIVTEQELLPNLPVMGDAGPAADGEPIVVSMDRDRAAIGREHRSNPQGGATPENLAYVIYTSGSTGKPKGVLVTHRNVARLFTATDEWFRFGRDDVWTLFHSYAFDFSVWEIWGALLYGGRLVVVPRAISRSPAAFYELLVREKVTVLNQTPSAFRQLIWAETAQDRRGLSLRYVIFGGEALELQSLRTWFERHGDQQPKLINMYGITETTVHVTYRQITMGDLEEQKGSVIGVPIPDLQVYVLNEKQELVAEGETGEMYVGGAGLARGYLNRGELTRERFLPNPFSRRPADRLYRTGDLARLLPNGDLEYLGRCDQQVKVRGFRIELGEIESTLNRHPAVKESAIVATGAAGEKRLVAYVVPHPAGGPSTAELRTFLQTHLPDYMVPPVFMFLERLPLTTNGKVDRRALPDPVGARPELPDQFAAPGTPEERLLAEIWSEVLEVQPVGIHDNFFELGGDSIRSIQILARAQQKGLRLTLAQLLETQTIHRLLAKAREAGSVTPSERVEETKPFSLISEADRQKLPRDVEDAYPALLLQRGMFFHNDLNPASAIYHDVFSFRIQFKFVPEKLAAAVAQFVARHPCLRTAFDLERYSQPLQLVYRTARAPFTVADLRHLNAEEQGRALDGWIEAEKRRPFHRGQAPLLRIHVQQYAAEVFQLIVSFHHVILDGWSLAAMLTELLQDYSALMKGTGGQIPPPRMAYRDFVALELKTLAWEECRRFWKETLKDPSFQKLPRRPVSQRAGGLEQTRGPEVQVPAEVFEGLKALAHSAGVPLRSVLLAAHLRVMGLLQGRTDVISGLVTNGRPEEFDGERMIGLFLNTVPVRLPLKGGTWTELVRETFRRERELLPYRRCPLAEIQRIAGGQPLFETVFDFVHFHVYRNLQGYQDMGFMEGHYFEANSFALFTTFMLDVTTTRLQMHCDYDPAELCLEQVEALCGYYQNTLRAMAADPGARYEDFSPLSEPEQKQLAEWNDTRRDYPREATIHGLFEEQVKRMPEAVAVVFGEQQLTYRELDREADRLARYLRKLGVGSEVLVGICLERSLEMVVGLLGVLKAGAAYVPMDPAYPKERPAFILKDTQASVLLTQRKLMANLPAHKAQVIFMDRPVPETAATEATQPGARADNLAYVIYTSGSTGQPKGVQVEHRAVVNFLTSMRREPGLDPRDVLLAVTTISFDIAGLELWLPLTTGARVVIAASEATVEGKTLAALMAHCGATVMQATPATWRMLVDSGWQGNAQLKILCGGDAWPAALVGQLLTRCGSLWNMYGPTETTIWSAVAEVKQAEVPLIGGPIANTQFHVLDGFSQPVPVGVAGELHIGGDGLARGYLNRPELTEERFILDPFSGEAGARLYKTGDLVRFLERGRIEFLGRMDDQVKIRGYRIELGEIESALRQHANVREVVVAAKDGPGGMKRLVAYVVARQEPGPKARELRAVAKEHLPEYMVPSAFVTLEALPLTPNGKVDRKALPEPDSRLETAEFVPPGTEMEKALAGIWREILGVEKVGLHDNFFELGGHSLIATQLISRLGKINGQEVSLRDLFETPTVAGLSRKLERMEAGAN